MNGKFWNIKGFGIVETMEVDNYNILNLKNLITYQKSSFLKRLIAFIIDGVLVGLVFMGLLIIMIKLDFEPLLKRRILRSIFWVIYIAYYLILESSTLQGTIGKMVLNIKIVSKNGIQIGVLTALHRNVAKALIYFTLGQGLFRLLIPWRRQAIHDEFAQCFVVSETKSYTS